MYIRTALLIALTFSLAGALAQKKIKLEPGSQKLSGFRKDGINYTVVTGNVKFTHKGTIFLCDSAVLVKKTNYIDAYGHVKILDGDSVTVIAKTLHYDGNTKIARLRQDVILTKLGQMHLYTNNLDYDRNTSVASYFNFGKIVDTTNVLTSQKGYFNTHTNFASFKTDVVGTNEDKTLRSDTLVYNTKTGIVYFVAPTEITDKDGNVFNYSEGVYNTKVKSSNLDKGIAETESYYLRGDHMILDDIRGRYIAQGNVYMLAKNDDIIITGQKAVMDKKTKVTKIFERPLLKMIDSKDTLYLTADTLVSIDSEEDINKRLLAYSNVKIFKTDLKGVCDSISYFVSDSIMFLYGKPALWSGENQMTADTIDMVIRNKSMNKIDLYPDAFVVTLDSAQYFNQIKGRSMEAFFKDDELSKVNVYGNGESIFFMRDEKTRKLIGMNKIICSDIILKFDDRKLTDASFLVKPEGDFIPPHELKESDTKLNGFTWRGGERPKKFELLANELKTQPKLEPQKEIEAVPIKLEKGINPEKRPLKERIKN